MYSQSYLMHLSWLNLFMPAFAAIIGQGLCCAMKGKINLVLNLKIQLTHSYSPLTLSNIIMYMVLLVFLAEK